jgi:hypothetical protein
MKVYNGGNDFWEMIAGEIPGFSFSVGCWYINCCYAGDLVVALQEAEFVNRGARFWGWRQAVDKLFKLLEENITDENKTKGIFLWEWFTFITLLGHNISTPMINDVVDVLKERE